MWNNTGYLKLWLDIKPLLNQLKEAQLKISEKSGNTNTSIMLDTLNTEISPLFMKLSSLLNTVGQSTTEASLLDLQSQELLSGAQKIVESLNLVQTIEYVLCIFGIIAAIIIALMTSRSVLRHINIFREHSSRIASGDLTRSISIESFDEMGLLGNDLNSMTKSLASIAKEITQSCHSMVTTLEEVRHAVDIQSSGASEQSFIY